MAVVTPDHGTRLVASPKVILTEMPDGSGLLLHMETKFYYTLNSVGVFVWKELSGGGGRSLDDVARKISERFDVSLERAADDVGTMTAEMLGEQLVAEADAGGR